MKTYEIQSLRSLQDRLIRVFFVILLLTSIILYFFSSSVYAATIIEADHELIRYTGRIDHSSSKAPSLWWPGSEITVCFEGTSIEVKLDDLGDNYFYAIVDGGTPKLIDLKPGLSNYTLASGLSDTSHVLKLFKRTETQEGQTIFRGFVLDQGKSLLPAPPRPSKRIEFFGDSITSGHSVASKSGDSNNADCKDNYYAYACITARELNAEYHCISVSGIGLYVDTWGAGGNMQTLFYDRLGPSKPWDFNLWTPDLVVINLGQNDAWGNHTALDVKKNYVQFALKIRKHYPEAYIILALGSMDATSKGSAWPSYLHAAVEILQEDYQDHKIHKLIFPFSGAPHPTAERQAAMANQLVKFIQNEIPGFER